MTAPFRHAAWCAHRDVEAHAACRRLVADIDLTDAQRVVVSLFQGRGVAPIITLVHRVGARETTVVLTDRTAGELTNALSIAVGLIV